MILPSPEMPAVFLASILLIVAASSSKVAMSSNRLKYKNIKLCV